MNLNFLTRIKSLQFFKAIAFFGLIFFGIGNYSHAQIIIEPDLLHGNWIVDSIKSVQNPEREATPMPSIVALKIGPTCLYTFYDWELRQIQPLEYLMGKNRKFLLFANAFYAIDSLSNNSLILEELHRSGRETDRVYLSKIKNKELDVYQGLEGKYSFGYDLNTVNESKNEIVIDATGNMTMTGQQEDSGTWRINANDNFEMVGKNQWVYPIKLYRKGLLALQVSSEGKDSLLYLAKVRVPEILSNEMRELQQIQDSIRAADSTAAAFVVDVSQLKLSSGKWSKQVVNSKKDIAETWEFNEDGSLTYLAGNKETSGTWKRIDHKDYTPTYTILITLKDKTSVTFCEIDFGIMAGNYQTFLKVTMEFPKSKKVETREYLLVQDSSSKQ